MLNPVFLIELYHLELPDMIPVATDDANQGRGELLSITLS